MKLGSAGLTIDSRMFCRLMLRKSIYWLAATKWQYWKVVGNIQVI